MKILVIGDLHGIKPRIHFKDFDCIIQVGDFCSDKGFRSYIRKWFKLLKKGFDYSTYEELIIDEIGKRGLKRLERESLKIGRKILEYLNSFGKPVFIVPGNWDQSYGKTRIKDMNKNDYSYMNAFYDFWLGNKINPLLTKELENIYDCQFKLHEFFGINFFGYGLSSGNEFLKKGSKLDLNKKERNMLKKAYKKIKNKLSSVYKKRNRKFPTIFLSHNVPYNTKLDIVRNKESYANKKHFGSTIARDFCKKYQPLICIGGHIHEHFGKDKIGKTIVVNAGFGKDVNVLIDLDENMGKIRKIEFYKKDKKKS